MCLGCLVCKNIANRTDFVFLICLFGFNKNHFYFRHKILDMLTKNPPFTKNMESPLCNEALVDQLWKLMNSGWFSFIQCCKIDRTGKFNFCSSHSYT